MNLLLNDYLLPPRSGTASWEDRPNSTLQRGDYPQRSRPLQKGKPVPNAGQYTVLFGSCTTDVVCNLPILQEEEEGMRLWRLSICPPH